MKSQVIGLSSDGSGIVKHEEKVIFLPLGIPGQIVRFRITHRKKQAFFGEIQEVLEESPHYIPPCDAEFPLSGGAPWQHIAYDEQLHWKAQFVKDSLERIAKQKNSIVDPIVPSPKIFRYRNKMEFSFGYSRMRKEILSDGSIKHHDENPGLGLHKRGNWREIVRCLGTCLSPEIFSKIVQKIEEFALSSELPVWNPIIHKGFWRNLILRNSERTGNILVRIVVSEKKERSFWNPIVSALLKEIPNISGIAVVLHSGVSVAGFDAPTETLFGEDVLEEIWCGTHFRISGNAFFQVNTESAEKLMESIKECADIQEGERVLDAFCGTGSIALALASSAKRVLGVEVIPEAIQNARENAKRNAINNTEFIVGSVESILPETLIDFAPHVVVTDPPRNGLPKKVRKSLFSTSAKKIILVSCNPATLARDILEANEFGWKLTKARPHDLFPNTPHVETVALLEKRT